MENYFLGTGASLGSPEPLLPIISKVFHSREYLSEPPESKHRDRSFANLSIRLLGSLGCTVPQGTAVSGDNSRDECLIVEDPSYLNLFIEGRPWFSGN